MLESYHMQPDNFKFLKVENISKSFPGVKALDNISLDIHAGKVHALMGENGAGKSTLIKILAGVYSKDSGNLFFDEKKIQIFNPLDSLKLGIQVVYQEIALIPEFTVGENIFSEKFPTNALGMIDWKKLYNDSNNLFEKIGFNLNAKTKTSDLSISEQQMVEIAKAVSKNALLVVMDEPTSSLTPNEIDKLFNVIDNLKKQNIAILYVTHKIDEIFRIADEVTVLRDGKFISHKDISATDEETIVTDMVGRKVDLLYQRKGTQSEEILLRVKDLSTKDKLNDISFDLFKGEILGFFGLMGAGRTELAKAIFGYDKIQNGQIIFNNKVLTKFNTKITTKMGMGYVTEDRKGEGLIKDMNLRENMTLPSLQLFEYLTLIDKNKEKKVSEEYIKKFDVKTPSTERLITLLSGGNQQKILLSRWLLKELQLIILDEPTRGVDVGAKSEVIKLVSDLADQGMSVILMTSEMSDLLSLSDRIVVMSNGKISKIFNRNQVTQEEIFKASISL
jgi:ribose transport system ATP-binding protein